jgi:hypothetical protein
MFISLKGWRRLWSTEKRSRAPACSAVVGQWPSRGRFILFGRRVEAELGNDSYIMFQFHDTGRNPRAKLRYLQHDARQKRAIVGTLTQESHTLG